MRHFSSIVPCFALALALVAGASVAPAFAQDDDLYGVPGAKTESAETPPSQPVQPEASPKKIAAPDAIPEAPRVDTAATSAPAVVPVLPPDSAKPSRPRVITRETTVNPLDTRRGSYRNPKKALFMSLVVPGLGQAYVGQNAFNYSRAVLYFGTEITLGLLWYNYTVVKYDREVKRYRRYADTHWSQGAYEEAAFTASSEEFFAGVNRSRSSYCDAVVDRGSGGGEALHRGCTNLLIPDSANLSASYQNFRNDYDDSHWFGATPAPDSVGMRRAGYSDRVAFYALIGRYQEFIGGWDDVQPNPPVYGPDSITGSSAHRDTYAAMRSKAQDYSRMQAWFIGGIALNHIASAVDAALTARRNNKKLYEGEARWYDRVGVDGGLAFQGGQPYTRMTASFSF